MRYILIVYFVGVMINGNYFTEKGGGATSAEFNSKEACESALLSLKSIKTAREYSGICVPQGER